jgi:ketohexokinase/beta-glucosidase
VNWTTEQWSRILWSDETWVTSGFYKQTYMTRKASEELEGTCLRNDPPKKRGWMFWGSFHGASKGPCLFWEKE